MIRLTSIVHGYPPAHNAGAEQYIHQVHRWLIARGHQVRVLVLKQPPAEEYQKVETGWFNHDEPLSDSILLTHLDATRVAVGMASHYHWPLVHVLHNDRQLVYHRVRTASLIVANSDWIRDSIPSWLQSAPQLTLYPPTFLADHGTDSRERDALTLVNLTVAKGAGLFYKLAGHMPDRQFIGVTGGYGRQMSAPRLANLHILSNRPDLRPVWDETRIYLQPSSYESFGKAAMEAMASGIPVIAHPTPGLKEALGSAGIFCDRERLQEWWAAIHELDDDTAYAKSSALALARARQVERETLRQLGDFEAALEGLM
jgi:Glycosyl transferases group 1